ncbi:MAG: acyl-ACP--UDP-N-acetylglucosamine O-acyltransferase [Dehalococcoidia bacterium]|nr:MAG: acyl-ACP--UDP-N-acetylglucosamine O-acyltransferase [Dehalococcoidia bacterium]
MNVHPTAVISSKAQVAADVDIGPYSTVEADVTIGRGCKFYAGSHICSGTTLGPNCIVHIGACLGGEPQDLAYKGARSYLKIGSNNVFREYSTVHRGTEEGSSTLIGDNNYFMCLSHIAHNCKIGDNVIICNNTMLAGYAEIADHAFVSAACLVHQFVRIGKLAMIGGGVRLNKDFPPYMSTAADNIVESYNIIGLKRAGLDAKTRNAIKQAHRILYRENLNTKSALEKIASIADSPAIKYLVDFIKSSKRGVCTAYSNRNIDSSVRR